jgi:hypothetical protein
MVVAAPLLLSSRFHGDDVRIWYYAASFTNFSISVMR